MFDIEYKGANCIAINAKNTSLIFDPNLALVGLKKPTVKDKVEIVTESRFKVDSDQRVIFEYAGNYEVGDFSITGVSTRRHIDEEADGKHSTMYSVGVGDMRVAVLGNIAPKLSEDQLEEMGVIDILVLPVGGNGYTLDSTSAAQITRQISPKVIVPVHYADDKLKYEVSQDNLDVFKKELGLPVESVGTKYKVKSVSSLPATTSIVEISRS